MFSAPESQGSRPVEVAGKSAVQPARVPSLHQWVEGFLRARRAGGIASTTIAFHTKRLNKFLAFCDAQGVTEIDQVDAGLLRDYLLHLAEQGHNPGGCRGHFIPVRALFFWYEQEAAPDGWRNPVRRVKPPKVPDVVLPPADLADIGSMLDACQDDREALRDRAILLALLDTGARAAELLAFNVSDFDMVTGALNIRRGKGGRGRVVFAGAKTRRAIRAYLRERSNVNADAPLFPTRSGGRLSYLGLRGVIRRRATDAGIKPPAIHAFRRACALAMLRGGADVVSVARLLGHRDLSVVQRYLKQTPDDLRQAHAGSSPVDRAGIF